jgi:hypothetical protein
MMNDKKLTGLFLNYVEDLCPSFIPLEEVPMVFNNG